jgi:hypothetical protein
VIVSPRALRPLWRAAVTAARGEPTPAMYIFMDEYAQKSFGNIVRKLELASAVAES